MPHQSAGHPPTVICLPGHLSMAELCRRSREETRRYYRDEPYDDRPAPLA